MLFDQRDLARGPASAELPERGAHLLGHRVPGAESVPGAKELTLDLEDPAAQDGIDPLGAFADEPFAVLAHERVEVLAMEATMAAGRAHAAQEVLVRPAFDARSPDSRDAGGLRRRQKVMAHDNLRGGPGKNAFVVAL